MGGLRVECVILMPLWTLTEHNTIVNQRTLTTAEVLALQRNKLYIFNRDSAEELQTEP